MQMFFAGGSDGDEKDPTPESIDEILKAGDIALAAMTLHADLVGPQGRVQADVERTIRCVEKTAALDGRFGDNQRPLLVWHPSGYPDAPDIDDQKLDLREFGRLLTTYAGWGMRIYFVAENAVAEEPVLEVREPES